MTDLRIKHSNYNFESMESDYDKLSIENDMNAQLAFLDSECARYDRKRPRKEATEEKETTDKKSSKGAMPSELKRACNINHMAIAKKFPKPPKTSWDKWKV